MREIFIISCYLKKGRNQFIKLLINQSMEGVWNTVGMKKLKKVQSLSPK